LVYTPRLPPYAHQTEALDKMRGREAFALLMSMRTGKSKVLIDDWGGLVEDDLAQDLMVVAPGGVYKTWETEIGKQLPDYAREKTMVHTWQSGGGSGHARNLKNFMGANDLGVARVFLVNVEALSSVDKARKAAQEFLGQGRVVMAIDESTVVKNPSAKRTKFIQQKLAPKAAYRRILSGLPTPRSPLDLFSQFEFLDWRILGHRSFYSFRARYAVVKKMDFGGRAVSIVVGYRNTDELWNLIAPHSYRVTLDQVREAAPPVYVMREVKMTAEQERIYRELKEFATSAIEADKHVTATAVITQILRLHQLLCGHVIDDDTGEIHDVPENRTAELLRVLEDYDGKAIIWCSYDHDVRKVSDRLIKEYGERAVARFWGGNRDTREEEESRFKNDPECRFEVATPAAGGRGRTWSVADLHVFYSSTADLEHRYQAEDRSEGVEKFNQATRIDLVVPGTVEERIIQTLRDKIDIASAITNDGYKTWLI
jgi:SNF2 family DNA or RNA helicase